MQLVNWNASLKTRKLDQLWIVLALDLTIELVELKCQICAQIWNFRAETFVDVFVSVLGFFLFFIAILGDDL